MSDWNDALCPEATIAALVELLGRDDAAGFAEIRLLVARYPGDPRLQFLHGSLLAARHDYAGAREAMRHAVDLAPDYAIARFQLGLLLLTSGEPHAAQEAWGPLHGLAERDPLRLFAQGLIHMIGDRFDEAIDRLQDGIAANTENLPLNRDMQMVIDEMRRKRSDDLPSDAPLSSAQTLLQQAALKSTRH